MLSASVLRIGSFDKERSGEFSLEFGEQTSNIRSSIKRSHSNVVFSSTNVMTKEFLAGVDVLVIGAPKDASTAITPLNAEEQSALLDFVSKGGGALLFSDNNIQFELTSDSIVSPFGLDASGVVNGIVEASVSNASHPIVSGEFGFVSNYGNLVFPGWFASLGEHAVGVASLKNNSQTTLAVIDPKSLSNESGGVVFFSDSIFFNGSFNGEASDPTTILINNSISFVADQQNVWKREIVINPKSTFLKTSDDPDALVPLVLDLNSLGISENNYLYIESYGSFDFAPPEDEYQGTSVIALFSSTSVVESSSEANGPSRIPGMIVTDQDPIFTQNTFFNDQQTDISGDFSARRTLVKVPEGATHMFIGANDAFFGDNIQNNSDKLRVSITHICDPSVDSDGDCRSDLSEVFAGTDYFDAGSRFQLSIRSEEEGHSLQWQARQFRGYELEVLGDAYTWNSVKVFPPSTEDKIIEYPIMGLADSAIYRCIVNSISKE